MKVLGLETSQYTASAAIVESGEVVGEFCVNLGPRKSEKFLPMIEELFRFAPIGKHELDGIAVTIGPGYFTALRVGLATAKALAFALGIPVVGVGTLDVLAHNLYYYPGLICSVIDVRRGDVFAAFYSNVGNGVVKQGEDRLLKPHELISMAGNKTIFVGSVDAVKQGRQWGKEYGNVEFAPGFLNIPSAVSCALIGEDRLIRNLTDNVMDLVPYYVKDAESNILREKEANYA